MPALEAGALRQLKHNDGSEGFVAAYDKDITDEFIAKLQRERDELRAKLNLLVETWDADYFSIDDLMESLYDAFEDIESVSLADLKSKAVEDAIESIPLASIPEDDWNATENFSKRLCEYASTLRKDGE